jgi:hypothetical protein
MSLMAGGLGGNGARFWAEKDDSLAFEPGGESDEPTLEPEWSSGIRLILSLSIKSLLAGWLI